jgi:hypothetical protein
MCNEVDGRPWLGIMSRNHVVSQCHEMINNFMRAPNSHRGVDAGSVIAGRLTLYMIVAPFCQHALDLGVSLSPPSSPPPPSQPTDTAVITTTVMSTNTIRRCRSRNSYVLFGVPTTPVSGQHARIVNRYIYAANSSLL